MKAAIFFAVCTAVSVVIAVCGLIMMLASCGPQWDATELERIRAVTCPSVCAAYADAVDAGVEITPEDEALIGGCECGQE